ncbi:MULTISPECIES: ATP-dependent nuclease [Isoptericola]|uniref:ATP-dependent nuclease n=1 Tax=Isoptericola TaxID=254250 RepID=UPI0013FD9688|nr:MULTISPECIES: AAA family ATPase [Isoptericola]
MHIENFRSIRSLTMDGLDGYNAIVGLNSAGKSNILRALNLFFNNHVDEGLEPLRFGTDYSSHAPVGKKKRVAVTVGLALGASLKVPKQRDFESNHGITNSIVIERVWSLAQDTQANQETFRFGPTLESMTDATADDLSSILAYIRAVRFVYIPNHARPADLIRQELEPLRGSLVARLRRTNAYRDSNVNDVLSELGRLGDRMFGGVSAQLQKGLPGTSISASLPDDFADLLFDVGLSAVSGGQSRAPEYEGSGAQSFMLLHILDLADRTRRSGGFGWVQASVWAMEEPESFLHAGLRAQFSVDLAKYALDDRRQVLVTTHQAEFLRVAATAWTTDKRADGDTYATKSSAKEALRSATRREITNFQHPLFVSTDRPVVIVEGKFDAIYLKAAIESLDLRPRWVLLSPQEALGQDVGGDSVLQYLRWNKSVIASRPDIAPVIVLRDWEATDANKYNDQLRVHAYSRALTCDASCVNPDLDDSWFGIERYLPTEHLKLHIPSGKLGLESAAPGARLSVKKKVLEEYKSVLARGIRDGGDPGDYLRELVRWLDAEVEETIRSVPVRDFVNS